MLSYIYKSLNDFRCGFSREITWIYFLMIVLGFIGSHEVVGVSSFCRFWLLDTKGYNNLIHFFKSYAWELIQLQSIWESLIIKSNQIVKVNGYAVLLGDHTDVPKDGRKMPGVVTLHQHSETQSKPSYFRGHFWGAIGVLTGTLNECFCLPLSIKIHQGISQISTCQNTENKTTSTASIVSMAMDFAIKNNVPSILVLDAYFAVATVFNLAETVYSIILKEPFVYIIVRAKKNYVAYFPADNSKHKKGRKPKYGDKVNLMEVFDQIDSFARVECEIYGKKETILIRTDDLLWKPVKKMIRFVFAETSKGRIVLMSNNFNLSSLSILELYTKRVRIETMFDMLKNLIKAFKYRFWSMDMVKHSRTPKRKKDIPLSPPEAQANLFNSWRAYEMFVFCGCVALGLLQLVSLIFRNSIWNKSYLFIRSISRDLPSEKTVKQVISTMLVHNYINVASDATLQKIRERYFDGKLPTIIKEFLNEEEQDVA